MLHVCVEGLQQDLQNRLLVEGLLVQWEDCSWSGEMCVMLAVINQLVGLGQNCELQTSVFLIGKIIDFPKCLHSLTH